MVSLVSSAGIRTHDLSELWRSSTKPRLSLLNISKISCFLSNNYYTNNTSFTYIPRYKLRSKNSNFSSFFRFNSKAIDFNTQCSESLMVKSNPWRRHFRTAKPAATLKTLSEKSPEETMPRWDRGLMFRWTAHFRRQGDLCKLHLVA